MNTIAFCRTGLVMAVTLLAGNVSGGDARTVDRLQTEARGFYLLWSQGRPDAEQILALPFVRGGQIVVQWAEVNPSPGQFDFSAIDTGLREFSARGRWATLQVNGNRKPAWLFARVPHVADRLSVQVQDRAGTLMFWHTDFRAAHLALLEALAAHLRTSPMREKFLGLRLNFNAVGTEHFSVPRELSDPTRWVSPTGVSTDGLAPFSPAVQESYEDEVVSTYDRLFANWTTVFVRNNLGETLRKRLDDKLRNGRLAWFHTSSEAEPRSAGTERQYGAFLDYCRSGQTVAYAEPWASAWGEHGGGPDHRWCSPAQWNYWTMLLNLHCGVSFIGEYYANLRFAVSGRHGRGDSVEPTAVGPKEFMAAYAWGADYVGRHNRPGESPGAWVAMRANEVVKAENPKTKDAGRKLTRFTGDYTWLAKRVGDDGSVGVGPVGPQDQRYGAFARRLGAGRTMQVRLDEGFAMTLSGDVEVRVIYLDEGSGEFELGLGGTTSRAVSRSGTNRWQVAAWTVSAAAMKETGIVSVSAGQQSLTLHLIEVRRLPAAAR